MFCTWWIYQDWKFTCMGSMNMTDSSDAWLSNLFRRSITCIYFALQLVWGGNPRLILSLTSVTEDFTYFHGLLPSADVFTVVVLLCVCYAALLPYWVKRTRSAKSECDFSLFSKEDSNERFNMIVHLFVQCSAGYRRRMWAEQVIGGSFLLSLPLLLN